VHWAAYDWTRYDRVTVAKNAAIEAAAGQWIIAGDPDEVYWKEDLAAVRDAIEGGTESVAFGFRMVNLFADPWHETKTRDLLPRVFRKSSGIRFECFPEVLMTPQHVRIHDIATILPRNALHVGGAVKSIQWKLWSLNHHYRLARNGFIAALERMIPDWRERTKRDNPRGLSWAEIGQMAYESEVPSEDNEEFWEGKIPLSRFVCPWNIKPYSDGWPPEFQVVLDKVEAWKREEHERVMTEWTKWVADNPDKTWAQPPEDT